MLQRRWMRGRILWRDPTSPWQVSVPLPRVQQYHHHLQQHQLHLAPAPTPTAGCRLLGQQLRSGGWQSTGSTNMVRFAHRIINDRMESTNPTSSSSQGSIVAMKNFLADNGRLTPLSSPSPPHTLWRTLRPPLLPTPGPAWGMGVFEGCARAIPCSPVNITLLPW